uniref:Inositol polyphosphate-related phosphatase domain-containing protein n=1 Tax=Periophthalmus magnuspinnatus TaxID=409849 RepID=A0A3B3Z990_9GOBI
MSENGEVKDLQWCGDSVQRRDAAAVKCSEPLKTPLDVTSLQKHCSDVKLPAKNTEGISPYQPRPPSLPRQFKTGKSSSVDQSVRTRRIRNSQESLSDRAETCSSPDSLKDDQRLHASTGFLTEAASHEQELEETESPVFRQRGSSLSEYEKRPQSQQSDPTELRTRVSKLRLSPVQPTGPLPSLEKNIASVALRAANRIDRDCLDYMGQGKCNERLHRNLSDSRLLENMGSDSASVSSMRSNYSVLSPIKPKDVRNRSFLEGSVLGNGALLGAEELERYFPERRLGIYISTWNMQGEKGLPVNLDDLLLPTDSQFVQDLYVIGVQEGCPDRYNSLGTSEYLKLSIFQLFTTEVEHATVTTRIISQIKTKGAVGCLCSCFMFTNVSGTGDSKVYERILDYNKIIEALALPKGLPDTNPYRSTPSDVTTRFDQVFWFGDFNFRLSKNREEVQDIINRTTGKDMGSLLEHDQLSKEIKDGSIFKGFQEAPIHFLPTYKFDIGCDTYDTSSKLRTPSYTDRILFRSRQSHDIRVIKYTSCTNIKTSDHRPVIGVFQAKLRPGRDNIPLGAGLFDRSLYLEGIRRRITRELKRREVMKNQSSSICSIS